MRKAIADLALSLVGLNEKDGSFKPIIDIYNKATSGYKVKYTDAWCATFVSALAIMQGIQDIFPLECSCARMVKKAQAMGIWVENDAFVPQIGDIIMYDWQDNGKGDNKGNPDHVGIVVNVAGTSITVVEGNKAERVGKRVLSVNGKYIRGYITPRYSDTVPTNSDTIPTPCVHYPTYNVTVTAAWLNVRKGPGTNYGVIKSVKKNTALTILEEQNGWGRIDSKGWVSLKWTKRV